MTMWREVSLNLFCCKLNISLWAWPVAVASSQVQPDRKSLLSYFIEPRPQTIISIGNVIESVSSTQNHNPIRIAIIGSTGVFAKKAHFPSFRSPNLQELFQIVGTWSHRPVANNETGLPIELAEIIAKKSEKCPVSSEKTTCAFRGHFSGESGWKEILSDPSVQAVDIVLPISVQPRFVSEALAAGKHVVSEKPILTSVPKSLSNANRILSSQKDRNDKIEPVKDLNEVPQNLWPYLLNATTGKEVDIDISSNSPPTKSMSRQKSNILPVWSVSENWRYEPAYQRLIELLKSESDNDVLRTLHHMEINTMAYIPPEHSLLQTGWRTNGESSLWVDIAVHYAAVIRELLDTIAAKKWRLTFAQQSGRDVISGSGLKPFDTVTAIFSVQTKEKKLITVVWTNSWQIRDQLFFERTPKRKALSNMVIKCHYNYTEILRVDRWHVSGTNLLSESWSNKDSSASISDLGEQNILLSRASTSLGPVEKVWEIPEEFSVERSLEDFGLAVLDRSKGRHRFRNTPAEALEDLKFIEQVQQMAEQNQHSADD